LDYDKGRFGGLDLKTAIPSTFEPIKSNQLDRKAIKEKALAHIIEVQIDVSLRDMCNEKQQKEYYTQQAERHAEYQAEYEAAQKELEEIRDDVKWALLYKYPHLEYDIKRLNGSIDFNAKRFNNGELTRDRIREVANEAREAKRKEIETEQAQSKKYNVLAAKGQFEFDGLLIQRQKKSTSFLLTNEGNKQVTAYEIIKRLAGKDAFKSYKKQMKFKNNKIQILPYAERIRLVWYFRKLYKMPPLLDNAGTIAAFANTAIKYTNNIQLKQNWKACLDVTNTQEEAATLFTCYGWALEYNEEFPRIENAFYTVDTGSGFRQYNIVEDDITFRLAAIEQAGRGIEAYSIIRNKKLGYLDKCDKLQSLLQPFLWWHDEIGMGLTQDARELCNERISEYIDNLLFTNMSGEKVSVDEHIQRVEIDKSKMGIEWAKPHQFTVSMDDIDFNDYQYNITAEYNKTNAAMLGNARSKKAAERNFADVTGDEWTTQELYAQGINKDKIPRLVNQGKIKRTSRGHYERVIC
jgi:hypothetical protein